MKTLIKLNGVWVEGIPEDGEWCKINVSHDVWIETRWTEPSLVRVKSHCVKSINPEAERRIKALDWKKERATEQPTKYSLDDVLAERQAIRDASNQAKLDIEALTTIEEVKAFTW